MIMKERKTNKEAERERNKESKYERREREMQQRKEIQKESGTKKMSKQEKQMREKK